MRDADSRRRARLCALVLALAHGTAADYVYREVYDALAPACAASGAPPYAVSAFYPTGCLPGIAPNASVGITCVSPTQYLLKVHAGTTCQSGGATLENVTLSQCASTSGDDGQLSFVNSTCVTGTYAPPPAQALVSQYVPARCVLRLERERGRPRSVRRRGGATRLRLPVGVRPGRVPHRGQHVPGLQCVNEHGRRVRGPHPQPDGVAICLRDRDDIRVSVGDGGGDVLADRVRVCIREPAGRAARRLVRARPWARARRRRVVDRALLRAVVQVHGRAMGPPLRAERRRGRDAHAVAATRRRRRPG